MKRKMDAVLKGFYLRIQEQEKKYGCVIYVPQYIIIDSRHLNCFWYGGSIGYILYKGYKIIVSANGDRIVSGKINGIDFYYKNKYNGCAYHDHDAALIKNDRYLLDLVMSNDPNNKLVFENNNWFEINLEEAATGEFIDLSSMDNVIDHENILDCFYDVSEYFKYVDKVIAQEELHAI